MELKYLYTLKTILETGSFQNAARKLNYTQSTITFQVQQLEQELSVKLFDKIGRKMILTQAGKDIMPYVDTILDAVNHITNFQKTASEITGTLKIALPETLLVYKLQPVLKAFRSQASRVKISLQILDCYEIKKAIADGSIDVGLHYDIPDYNSSVHTDTLFSHTLVLAASPSLSAAQQDFISEHQQKDITWIHGNFNSIYADLFCDYLKEKDIQLNGSMIMQSIEAIKKSVSSNLGIAFLPRFSVEAELKENTLKELKLGLSDITLTACVSYHKNKWINPAMELFIQLVKEHLSE